VQWPDQAHHVGSGQASQFSSEARAEEPKPEVQRAESGGGVLGEGTVSPSPPARESAERCKLTQWVVGRSPGPNRFSFILEAPDSLFRNLLGPRSEDHDPLSPA